MMDPFTAATGIAGLLSLALQITNILDNQIRVLKNASKDAEALLVELKSLMTVLESLEGFLQEQSLSSASFHESSTLLKSMQDCNLTLTNLVTKLQKGTTQHGISKTLAKGSWYLQHEQHVATVDKVHRHLAVFQLALNLDGLKVLSKSVKDVLGEIEHLQSLQSTLNAFMPEVSQIQTKLIELENIKILLNSLVQAKDDIGDLVEAVSRLEVKWATEDDEKIADWLSPLQFGPKQSDVMTTRHQQTGSWFLESPEFREWIDGSQKILLCPGIPGAGKTILAGSAIDFLQTLHSTRNISLAFIYCNYKEQSVQTVANLVSSLVQQLVRRACFISPELQNLYKKHQKESTRPSVSELLILLKSELSRSPQTFIIVDALDETNDQPDVRGQLVNILKDLGKVSSLLITTRYNPSIEDEFDSATRLEIIANRQDIEAFIDNQLNNHSHLLRHFKADPTLRGSIVQSISQKTNGMFLLAKLHLDSLAREDNRKAIRKALEKLPTELDNTYRDALDRIMTQSDTSAARAMEVLCWVVGAFRPLSPEELQHALAIEPRNFEFDEDAIPDLELLISVCGGLVTIDSQSNIVRLAHYTTNEYLLRRKSELWPDADEKILWVCMTSLLSTKLPSSSNRRPLYSKQILLRNYPLWKYSVSSWFRHAKYITSENGEIQQYIYRIFYHDDLLLRLHDEYFVNQDRSVFLQASIEKIDSAARLAIATEFGLVTLVLKLLEEGIDVNYPMPHLFGSTALHLACHIGHNRLIRVFISRGANLESSTRIHGTPLECALKQGHVSAARLLIDQHINFDVGKLFSAALFSHQYAMADELIREVMVNAVFAERQTLLHFAAENNNVDYVMRLLAAGADIEARDSQGNTALCLAARYRALAVVAELLKRGADVNARVQEAGGLNLKGPSPLSLAAEYSGLNMVSTLLEAGAIVTDNEVDYALKCGWGASEDVMEKLVFHPTYIRTYGWPSDKILRNSIRHGYSKVFRLLFEKGANPLEIDEHDQTLLHEAACVNKDNILDIFDVLISSGVEIGAKNKDGETALSLAARKGCSQNVKHLIETHHAKSNYDAVRAAIRGDHRDIAKYLFETGLDYHHIDGNGYSFLHHAGKSKCTRVTKYLLDEGLNIALRNANGDTLLSLLVSIGGATIVQNLFSSGCIPLDRLDDNDLRLLVALAKIKGYTKFLICLLKHCEATGKRFDSIALNLPGYEHYPVVCSVCEDVLSHSEYGGCCTKCSLYFCSSRTCMTAHAKSLTDIFEIFYHELEKAWMGAELSAKDEEERSVLRTLLDSVIEGSETIMINLAE